MLPPASAAAACSSLLLLLLLLQVADVCVEALVCPAAEGLTGKLLHSMQTVFSA
jgi:hypothetical protein